MTGFLSALLGNMVFMQPILLAGLLVLPVLWFLLRVSPPLPRVQVFPALMFLRDLVAEEQSPKHTPWWILLLRLLLAALVIIALARPVYNPAEEIGGSGPVRLVLDNGWAAAQSWDLQEKAATELLSQAGREKREVYVFLTAPAPGQSEPQQFGPMLASDALTILRGLAPQPWPSDYRAAAKFLEKEYSGKTITNVWFGDGLDDGQFSRLARVLSGQGTLHYLAPSPARLPLLLRPEGDHIPASQKRESQHSDLWILVDGPRAMPEGRPVSVQALGESGGILDIQSETLSPSRLPHPVGFDIPPAKMGGLQSLRLAGRSGAGGLLLLDDSYQKKAVGIVAPAERTETAPLVGAPYYLKRALEPFAIVSVGDVETLLAQKPAVMILPDVGAMPGETLNALEAWVKDGGLLLRFSGPQLSETATQAYLLPVKLRNGDRSLSGALSWENPQKIAPFSETSPFFGLDVPDSVTVEKQVLADPAQDLEGKVWAALEDGTPLITGSPLERGQIVLVHTTADPLWSDLSLSGLYVDLLKRIVRQAGSSKNKGAGQVNYAALEPLTLLDGWGNLVSPPDYAQPISVSKLAGFVPDSSHPPGIYGRGQTRVAINLGASLGELKAVGTMPSDVTRGYYDAAYEVDLMPYFLLAALFLFLLDWAIMLILSSGVFMHGFSKPRASIAGAIVLLFCVMLPAPSAFSQDQVEPSQVLMEDFKYAEDFYLAYVRTGDATLDQHSREGLEALAKVLTQRTSVEPAGVAGVDPAVDTLAFFPILYWPVSPAQSSFSDQALQNIQDYLNHGGTILFDTLDAASSSSASAGFSQSAQGQALRTITDRLSIPPLEKLPKDHVLGKTFYLIDSWEDTFGARSPLWVEQRSVSGRDGVSSVLISGQDWAGIWAKGGAVQRAPSPSVRLGLRRGSSAGTDEMALRFGVNLVMYALTGNYKADQVHLPHILRRLDR